MFKARSLRLKPIFYFPLCLSHHPFWLHCDDLNSHLLTWIICRQEQNRAEKNNDLRLSLSLSSLPLNHHRLSQRLRLHEIQTDTERKDREIYDNG